MVRNLVENTPDNSRREWPRLISSLENLISDKNVYTTLQELKDDNKLIGLNVDQRKEEIFKAILINKFTESKALIHEIEDHKNFKGNITNILLTPFIDSEVQFNGVELDINQYEAKHLGMLKEIYKGYKKISEKDFNIIWGNLLITTLYSQTYESRLVYSGLFKKHPAVLIFAKKFSMSKLGLTEYIIKIQKKYVIELTGKYEDFSKIRFVTDQLYLYYIISERVYNLSYSQFFKNHNFNFGWLKKETGYRSLFTDGIENCKYFPSVSPIFQVYNHQFRFNLGLNLNNTLDIEIIGRNKKKTPFDLIIKWAKDE